MKLIVGLGNPGSKYETTRHNVGFLAIDRLIDRWHATGPASKFNGQIFQATFQGEKLCLVKPQTFMNLSGECLGRLYAFYQCQPEDLIVLHDDLDVDAFTLRLKKGGGTGGHNGLKSIDAHLGQPHTGYYRIRIGIGHPSRLEGKESRIPVEDYVLSPYKDQDLHDLDPFLDEVAEATEEILKGKIQEAMNKYHRNKAI